MKFKVGDVCVIKRCNHINGDRYVGREITITKVWSGREEVGYETDIPCWVEECCLELKRPPREALGDWDLCPWRPGLPVSI